MFVDDTGLSHPKRQEILRWLTAEALPRFPKRFPIRRWAQIIDVYSISQNVINELNIRPQEFYILDTPKGPDGSPPWGIQVHFHGLPKAYLFQRGKNSKKFPKVAKNARTLCNRAKRTL